MKEIIENIKAEYMNCNDKNKLKRFIWDIHPVLDSIRERYFRMLNHGIPSHKLDYRLKEEKQ